MKTWIPVAAVILAAFLLYPKFPTQVNIFMFLILIVLLINKWPQIQGYFK